MSEPPLDSVVLQCYLDRWRSGDRQAADELLRITYARLEKLARRLSRTFPNVRTRADYDDVLQNSILRFLKTLQNLRPATARDFFNLAAVHIRRELLDLARQGRSKRTVPIEPRFSDTASVPEPTAPSCSGPDEERWIRFHEAVDLLPVEEREVVGLIFYHGWTQDKIAELFQVDVRTIRRWWASACHRLRQIVGELPKEA